MAAGAPAFAKPEDDASMWAQFRSEDWLRSRPLSVATIMEYFRMSPWYDLGSINERALTQGLTAAAARNLTGLEYRVLPQATQAEGLIVLEAWRRFGPGESDAELTCLYYCLWGTVYQAPDMFSALAGRARRAASHIQSGMASAIAAATLPHDPPASTTESTPKSTSEKRERAGDPSGISPDAASEASGGALSLAEALAKHRQRKQFQFERKEPSGDQQAVVDASIAASTESALHVITTRRQAALAAYVRAGRILHPELS